MKKDRTGRTCGEYSAASKPTGVGACSVQYAFSSQGRERKHREEKLGLNRAAMVGREKKKRKQARNNRICSARVTVVTVESLDRAGAWLLPLFNSRVWRWLAPI